MAETGAFEGGAAEIANFIARPCQRRFYLPIFEQSRRENGMFKIGWALALLLCLLTPSSLDAQTPSSPTEAWTDKLLAQVGGREVWARARGFHMVEIMKSASYPQPVIREFWVDFAQPRIMSKTLASGVNQLEALNGTSGWRLRNGALESWNETKVNDWRGFWPGIPTRIFHLLALRDPRVELRANRPDRMDVLVDGRFVLWLATSADGTPLAYGRQDNHLETHFLGEMRQYGPVKLWDAAYEPGDSWQVEMIEYRLLDKPHAISFAPPSSRDTDPDPSS